MQQLSATSAPTDESSILGDAGDTITLPFDRRRLDRSMERAGIDLVLATSKHNVQYLLGGYYSLFFAHMEPIGLSRYLAALGYPREQPGHAFYVGSVFEIDQQAIDPLWVPTARNVSWESTATVLQAVELICDLGLDRGTIGIEMPFLPADAYRELRQSLPNADFADAVVVLEDLRAVKRPEELQLLREASEGIVDSILSVFQQARHGLTTHQIAELLEREEVAHGLTFDYCLVTAGTSLNRTPSSHSWAEGEILCLDSGGQKRGYIGDLARMSVMGQPSPEQQEILHEIDAIQMAARRPVRAGALGQEIYDAALAAMESCPHRSEFSFVAHGMGLVSHEAPRLTSTGPVPYPSDHNSTGLEPGMVLAIETEMASPRHGFIKLEDTIAVTESGWQAYGDGARGWNCVE